LLCKCNEKKHEEAFLWKNILNMTIFYSKEPIYRQTNDILSANVHLTPTETGKNSIEKALFFVQKK